MIHLLQNEAKQSKIKKTTVQQQPKNTKRKSDDGNKAGSGKKTKNLLTDPINEAEIVLTVPSSQVAEALIATIQPLDDNNGKFVYIVATWSNPLFAKSLTVWQNAARLSNEYLIYHLAVQYSSLLVKRPTPVSQHDCRSLRQTFWRNDSPLIMYVHTCFPIFYM